MAVGRRETRRWKNQPLTRERDSQRARFMWATLAVLIAAAAPIGLYLHEQNTCLQLSYEIEEVKKQREKLTEGQRRLEVERASVPR